MGWSTTSQRLLLAFASLVTIFGMATWAAVSGLADVTESVREVNHHEQGVRAALNLAGAVRDQYAHQAHTIILGNATHLRFYDEARQRVVSLHQEVRRFADAPEERRMVDEMGSASDELDRVFRDVVVPAVLAGDRHAVEREHARILSLVSSIQSLVDGLAEHFQKSIDRFQERADRIQRRTARLTLATLGGALLFAIAVGVYLSRSVARPIRSLAAGTERLASGDLDTPIVLQGPDEFVELAGRWNAMMASLKEHQTRLVQSEKLAGIGRLAAGVAHEINNPLGVILGYTKVLRRKAEGSLADDLGIIEEESLRCQEIVQGLLDLSRPVPLSSSTVNLRQLCDEVVARLGESDKLPPAEVRVRGTALADGDARRLRQVIWNLVQNAIEAAGAGGHVGVWLDDEHGASIAVTDDGPGLPPANRERLFEPFFTTKASGTGLGLAVSEAIARAHGGTIEVSSESPTGARFTLRLPHRREEAA